MPPKTFKSAVVPLTQEQNILKTNLNANNIHFGLFKHQYKRPLILGTYKKCIILLDNKGALQLKQKESLILNNYTMHAFTNHAWLYCPNPFNDKELWVGTKTSSLKMPVIPCLDEINFNTIKEKATIKLILPGSFLVNFLYKYKLKNKEDLISNSFILSQDNNEIHKLQFYSGGAISIKLHKEGFIDLCVDNYDKLDKCMYVDNELILQQIVDIIEFNYSIGFITADKYHEFTLIIKDFRLELDSILKASNDI